MLDNWTRARRRAALSGAPLALFVVYVLVYLVRGHWPFLHYPYEENVDESYLLAVGMRMLRGELVPFTDGVAHAGPIFLYIGALIAAFDPFSFAPIRYAALIGFMLIAALIALCGRAAGRPLAGAVGSAAVPVFTFYWLWQSDGIAFNSETPIDVFVLAALWSTLQAVGPRASRLSARWTAAAGVLVALAVLTKPTGVLMVVPIAVYFVSWLFHRTAERAERRRLGLVFVVAGLLPVALVLLWSAFHGGLRDMYYYVVVYNRDVYMKPLADHSRYDGYRTWIGSRPMEMALISGAVAHAAAQWIGARRSTSTWRAAYLASSFPVTLAALAVTAFVSARASMRDFGHYYLMLMPWVGLIVGELIEGKTSEDASDGPGLLAAYRATIVLPLMLALELMASVRSERMQPWLDQRRAASGPPQPLMCGPIRAHSEPGQPIFVWGFQPGYYVACERYPASRYVFTTFVAGVVPWDFPSTKEQEDALAVPDSRQVLIAELERSKPPVIVDAGGTSLRGHPMDRYDDLRAYLVTHYHPAESIGGETAWLRNEKP